MGRIRRFGGTRALWGAALVVVLVSALAVPVSPIGALDEGDGPATLVGAVVDEGNGGPIDGALVCIYEAADSSSVLCNLTDSSGGYSFGSIPEGDYVLHASPPVGSLYLPIGASLDGGYTPFPPIELTLVSGSQNQDIPLVLGGALEITVTAPDGTNPAVGEPVSWCRSDAPGEPGSCPQMISSPGTDANGQVVTTALVPGEYEVRAGFANSPYGYPAEVGTATVQAGIVNPVGLRMIAGGALDGFVRDGSGVGIQGATVSINPVSGFGTRTATTDLDGYYAFASLRPDTYSGTVSPPLGGPYGSVATGTIVVDEFDDLDADFTLPPPTVITGTASPGSIVGADGAGVLVCGGFATPVLSFPPSCSDGSPFGLVLVPPTSAATFTYVPPAAGTYTIRAAYYSGPTPLGASPSVLVSLAAGETVTCTLVAGTPGSATCGAPPPPPTTGTVSVQVSEPVGLSYFPGFCAVPGRPVLGSFTCSDGRPATILFGVAGGSTQSVTLPAGDYWAGMASSPPLIGGATRLVSVTAGETLTCSFTVVNGPVCDGGDDGDGVVEPPGYDGNGDLVADDQQAHVTSFAADGGGTVTLAAPSPAFTIADVSASATPADPPLPPGADLPVGVLGFSVVLPAGVTNADVTVTLPPGTNPNAYLKLHGGVWVDFTANATISGDTVVLHLVDGGAGDADGAANGIIEDPGGPAIVDLDPPTVTCPSNVHFALNQAGAQITATVSDAGSGPESPTVTVPAGTAVVGAGSVEVTGRDLAGNETTVSCGYTVDAPPGYTFQGFGWPVDNGRINVVKSGRHVPLTWRVVGANGAGVAGASTFGGITSATIICPALPSDRVELTLPFAIAPSHIGAGVWLGTWKAPKAVPGKCTALRLTLSDGSVHTTVFRVVS